MDDYLFKVSKWNKPGALGLTAWVLSFVAAEICKSVFHMSVNDDLCPMAFILLQLIAAGCGFVAALLGGNKAWFLLPLCSVGMVFVVMLRSVELPW